MDAYSTRQMAQALIRENGLVGWTFSLNNNKTRVGVCKYRYKRIEASALFIKNMTEAQVRNVITHEVAHALVGYGHGHDAVWARMHRSLGGDGKRCQTASLEASDHKWKIVDGVTRQTLGYANRKGKRLAASVCTCHRVAPIWVAQN